MQVFFANLKVLLALLAYIVIELTIAYTVNGSGKYVQLQADYFLMVDRVEWWPWANKIRETGIISVAVTALVTQSLSLYGVLGWLNLLVWKYAVGVTGFFVLTAYLVMLGIAYEASFSTLYGPYSATARESAK